MRRLCLINAVVVLLALVAGPVMAQAPPDWVPQASVPVALTVDGYGKVTVVNSSLDLEISMEGPPPEPGWEIQDFVHLDIEANMDVILDVHATQNGRLRSDQGFWFKDDWEHGTRLDYMVCGGWANTPEEFEEYFDLGPPIPELGPGSWWIAPGSGPPWEENHLWNWQTNQIGYPILWGADSMPVTLGGSAEFRDSAPDPIPPPMGVYRGELIVTITPAPVVP